MRVSELTDGILDNLIGSRWVFKTNPDRVVEVVDRPLPHLQRVVTIKSARGVRRLNLDVLLSKYRRLP